MHQLATEFIKQTSIYLGDLSVSQLFVFKLASSLLSVWQGLEILLMSQLFMPFNAT